MTAYKELPETAVELLERQGVALVYAPDVDPEEPHCNDCQRYHRCPARDAEARRA